ncbi:MAG: MOSC domain-containing protein [Dehalococcoidales bacterium]
MASIVAVCTSNKKGIRKEAITEGLFQTEHGLVGDAHAGVIDRRQVSLLATESIDKMRNRGLELVPGDFAENLTTEGIDLHHLPIGTRLTVGDEVALEISQIGKECHTACAIRRKVGECIMPEEGVFARVITGGTIRTGDRILKGETRQ